MEGDRTANLSHLTSTLGILFLKDWDWHFKQVNGVGMEPYYLSEWSWYPTIFPTINVFNFRHVSSIKKSDEHTSWVKIVSKNISISIIIFWNYYHK